MPTVELPLGTIEYRTFGPDDPAAPTAVFVHGFLVNGTLWDPVAERLAAAGVRSIVPDWPLGSHHIPVPADRVLSPDTVAGAIHDLIAALDLRDVVLVGSDTGGGLCQLSLRDDIGTPERAGRIAGLVLTNCDAFEVFPPKFFVPLFLMARSRPLTWQLVQTTRPRLLRHSPLAYGQLLLAPRPATLTRSWIRPAVDQAAIRRDINRLAQRFDRRALVESASWLERFDRPVRLVWGMRDRHFTPALARRLATTFPNAELVEVADGTTFVSIDRPAPVTSAIAGLLGRDAPA